MSDFTWTLLLSCYFLALVHNAGVSYSDCVVYINEIKHKQYAIRNHKKLLISEALRNYYWILFLSFIPIVNIIVFFNIKHKQRINKVTT